MTKEERALAMYVNKATDLAEAVKADIQKKGYISNKTILALNAFITAANNVRDLTYLIEKVNKELN